MEDDSKVDAAAIDRAKRAAAFIAVTENVMSNMIVGIGSGSTVVFAVEAIAAGVKRGDYKNLVCVPTSFQSRNLIMINGLRLGDVEVYPEIDLAIDGADEVDEALNCIKGGGGCHLQEKVVAFNAKKFVVIADNRKDSKTLGDKWKKGIPVSCIPFARTAVARTFARMGYKPVLRMATAKAGPVVTDNGALIFDVFPNDPVTPAMVREVDTQLRSVPGVIETGLFCGIASVAYFGNQDGTVSKRTNELGDLLSRE